MHAYTLEQKHRQNCLSPITPLVAGADLSDLTGTEWEKKWTERERERDKWQTGKVQIETRRGRDRKAVRSWWIRGKTENNTSDDRERKQRAGSGTTGPEAEKGKRRSETEGERWRGSRLSYAAVTGADVKRMEGAKARRSSDQPPSTLAFESLTEVLGKLVLYTWECQWNLLKIHYLNCTPVFITIKLKGILNLGLSLLACPTEPIKPY